MESDKLLQVKKKKYQVVKCKVKDLSIARFLPARGWNFKFFNEVAERPLRVQLEANDDAWRLSSLVKISNFDQ